MLGVSGYLQCLRLDFHCRTRKPTAQALNQTGLSQNVKLRLAYWLAFVTNINKKRIKGGFKCRVCYWSWTNQQIRAEVRTLPWSWHQRLRRAIFGRLPEAAATVLSDWCLYPSLIILGTFFSCLGGFINLIFKAQRAVAFQVLNSWGWVCRVCQVCKVRRLASPFGRSDHLIQAKQLNKERKAPTQLHGLQVGLHRSLPNSNTSQVRMLESLHKTRILQRNGSVNSLRWIIGINGIMYVWQEARRQQIVSSAPR